MRRNPPTVLYKPATELEIDDLAPFIGQLVTLTVRDKDGRRHPLRDLVGTVLTGSITGTDNDRGFPGEGFIQFVGGYMATWTIADNITIIVVPKPRKRFGRR